MPQILIVGVDGSETAMKAARTAATMAAAMGAVLNVVTAYASDRTDVVEIAGEQWTVSDAAEAKKVAQRVAALLQSNGIQTLYTAVQGKPHEVLVAEAERLGASMIVVGNRRMKGLGVLTRQVSDAAGRWLTFE